MRPEQPEEPAVDREVEAWLRDVRAPAPRPGFADEARDAFLAGASLETGESSGSLAGRDARSAGLMIEDILRSEAPPPPARAAFQDDLRARFVRGELEERFSSSAAIRPGPGSARGPALRLVLGTLAAAAALWLVARLVLPGEPGWRGSRADGIGPVVVDGRELVPRDLSELGGAFQEARSIESRGRRLELVRDGDLTLAVMPGTRFEVRSNGSDGELRLALLEGEVYLKSVEGYRGPAVIVETDDMDMRMTGTVVGVMKNEMLSCICIARGKVEVTPRGKESKVCLHDTSNVVDESGEVQSCDSEEAMAMDPAHITGLRDFAHASF